MLNRKESLPYFRVGRPYPQTGDGHSLDGHEVFGVEGIQP